MSVVPYPRYRAVSIEDDRMEILDKSRGAVTTLTGSTLQCRCVEPGLPNGACAMHEES